MADKKWSEFELLESIKDKNIELLTVIEDNTSMTKYDNKRIKLSDILDPINLDITNIKQQIQNIQVEGFNLTTIGVDPPDWYANEDDPYDTQLVELSIAKDLKDRLDETNSKVQKNIEDITTINKTISDLDYEVDKNQIDIDSLQLDVTKITNRYFNKNDIIQTVEDDETEKVPSSNAIFDFVKNAKTEANNYTNTKVNEVLNKINNLDFSGFYFDDTIKNGDYASERESDDVVINRLSQKIFVVTDNQLYQELSLNRPEVLEIANKVVDWHNSNIKEMFIDEVYELSLNEAHSDFQGKYVGKTNDFSNFICIDSKECSLVITNSNHDSLYATNAREVPQSDCYIILDSSTQVTKLKEDNFVPFVDYIKPKYKNLFSSGPVIIKILYETNQWQINFKENCYSSNRSNFNNIDLWEIFISNENFILKTKCFTDFYQSNSSEVFNDYKQFVPKTIDYFHSVHNLNNKFITQSEEQITIQISSFQNETDTYAVICDSQGELNLLDYLGYSLYIPLDSKVTCKDPSIVKFEDCFNSPPKNNYYLIQKGCTNQDEDEFKPIITLSKYNVDGIYESFINKYTGTTGDDVSYGDGTDLKLDLLPITIENITICSNFTESDCYLNTKPSFITGKDNLCSRGNQFILGCENIPTDSVFIIGHPSNKVLDANTNCYENFGSSRDNIFEINQDGLIFIKSPVNLKNWYKNDNNVLVDNNPGDYSETLNLEYKCLQKILIDLNSKILELSEKNSELQIELSLLKNRVEELEEP